VRNRCDRKDTIWAFVFSSRNGHIWALSQLLEIIIDLPIGFPINNIISLNCPYAPTTPTVHSTTISRFLCNFFPRIAPHFFGHHDSPRNLAKSRYPLRGSWNKEIKFQNKVLVQIAPLFITLLPYLLVNPAIKIILFSLWNLSFTKSSKMRWTSRDCIEQSQSGHCRTRSAVRANGL